MSDHAEARERAGDVYRALENADPSAIEQYTEDLVGMVERAANERDGLRARVEQLQQERDQLAEVADRLIDTAVGRWHDHPDTTTQVEEWLGLTWDEYKAWVEGNAAALAASRRAER